MGNDLPMWTSIWKGKGHVAKLKRIHTCSHSHVQPHRLPTGAWPWRETQMVTGVRGHVTNRRARQGTGALCAEPPPRTGAFYGPSHHAGCAPGARLAVWDLCGYHLQPEVLLPCHMSAVRSPRKCLASFYISIFLLMPSNILDLQDEKNKISQWV